MHLKNFTILATLLTISALGAEPTSHLQVGAGVFDINRKWRPRSHHAGQLLLEYRPGINWYHIRPLVAFTFTNRGSYYLCGGAAWDGYLFKKLVIIPSFAPGFYWKGHRGKRLGFPLEFRSSIELAYVLDNQGRIGIQYYHISNASMGKRNPGSESLILYYAIPLRH